MINDFNVVKSRLAAAQTAQVKQADPKSEEELKAACEGFEAIFTKKLLESMRDTLPGNGLFPKSNSLEIFESMLDQNLAENSSRGRSSMGIKDYLFDQLKASL
ncbi:MAG: rod-binding protein [Desulfobacter sp.]|nr:MAG: rod-binding protein [Desulfobacter sp.]